MSKHTKGTWNISNNTDSTDIDQQCIGLDATRTTFPKDVAEHIHQNRGLHVQIRHNRDRQTFSQANELARLIAAAPEMLQILNNIVSSAPLTGLPLALEKDIQDAIAVIKKIEGRS